MGSKGLMKRLKETPDGSVQFKADIVMCDGDTDVHMEMETKYAPMNVLMVLESTVRWAVEAIQNKGVNKVDAIRATQAAYMAGIDSNAEVIPKKGA